MKIVFNGVSVVVAKGSSVNLANGVIEVNMTQPTKKKTTNVDAPTTSVAQLCRSVASKIKGGSAAYIVANNDNTIRKGFESIGMRVSVKRTEKKNEFRVVKAK